MTGDVILIADSLSHVELDSLTPLADAGAMSILDIDSQPPLAGQSTIGNPDGKGWAIELQVPCAK